MRHTCAVICSLVILGFTFTNSALSETLESSILKCKDLSGDIQRLSCFDTLFKDKESSPEGNRGSWMINEKISPIDDGKNLVISLYADRPIETNLKGKSMPMLVIRCAEKKIGLYVNWGIYLGTKSSKVTYRLDSDKAIVSSWDISTDNKAIFYSEWDGGAKSFIQQLSGKNKLYMSLTPYGEAPVSAIFYLDGLDTVIKPLKELCGL